MRSSAFDYTDVDIFMYFDVACILVSRNITSASSFIVSDSVTISLEIAKGNAVKNDEGSLRKIWEMGILKLRLTFVQQLGTSCFKRVLAHIYWRVTYKVTHCSIKIMRNGDKPGHIVAKCTLEVSRTF